VIGTEQRFEERLQRSEREIRTPAMQAGIDRKAADAAEDLLFENSRSGIVRDRVRVRLPGNIVLY
jgi:hypothetical protein